MDRKVVGVVLLEWLQWSHHPQLLDVVWCSVVVVVVVVVAVVVVVCQSDLEHADFTEDGWPASRWLVWPLGIRFLLRETDLACVAFSSDEIKLNEVEKLVTLKLSASKTDPSARC